jgi:integrase
MSEAIELEWRDVDLQAPRVIFWRTKSGARRDVALSPRTVAALASLPHREGRVFRWSTQRRGASGQSVQRVMDYADRGRQTGGQIRKAWAGAIRRGGLTPDLTPHDLRHTCAETGRRLVVGYAGRTLCAFAAAGT